LLEGFLEKAGGMVVQELGEYSGSLSPKAPDWWIADCSMVSDNILLSANAMGLGAIWTALYPLKQYMDRASTVLGLSDDLIPLNLINIGYPAQNPEPKDKWDPGKVTYIK